MPSIDGHLATGTHTTPEFLTIGHVTRDILADGSFELGGTVSFAALTTYRLGLVSAIVTCADADWVAHVSARLPSIGLAGHVCSHTTTFVNRYSDEGFRTQYLRARADDLHTNDVPAAWKNAPNRPVRPARPGIYARTGAQLPAQAGKHHRGHAAGLAAPLG